MAGLNLHVFVRWHCVFFCHHKAIHINLNDNKKTIALKLGGEGLI
jgi:hypothetical protein